MLYDDQATSFDERAGVPFEASRAIADALAGLTGIQPGDTLLEIGAGTGSLSMAILELGVHYVGFDRSESMLEVFAERVRNAGLRAQLVQANGNRRWPVRNNSVAVVFASRAIHHLAPQHVAVEMQRCIRNEGGWLVLGQIHRPEDSVKDVLRRRMRQILKTHNVSGRSHEARTKAVFSALERAGAVPQPVRVAARWRVPHTPAASLNAWDEKQGLAGLEAPDDVKKEVLAELRAWALDYYGDLDRPLEQQESFELASIYIPGNQRS